MIEGRAEAPPLMKTTCVLALAAVLFLASAFAGKPSKGPTASAGSSVQKTRFSFAGLLHTAGYRGQRNHIWISRRSDGRLGSGKEDDPYDASGGLPGTIWDTIVAAKPAIIEFVPKFRNVIRKFSANATSDSITTKAHGLVANDTIRLSTTGTLPAPLGRGVTYHVISSGLTVDAFKVSTSHGGPPVNITDAGSGIHQWNRFVPSKSYVITANLPLWNDLKIIGNGSTILVDPSFWVDPDTSGAVLGDNQPAKHFASGVIISDFFFDCNILEQGANANYGMIWLYGRNNLVTDCKFVHYGSKNTNEAFMIEVGDDGEIANCEVTSIDVNTRSITLLSASNSTQTLRTTYRVNIVANYIHDIKCPNGSSVQAINFTDAHYWLVDRNRFSNTRNVSGIYADFGRNMGSTVSNNMFTQFYGNTVAGGPIPAISFLEQRAGWTNTDVSITNNKIEVGHQGRAINVGHGTTSSDGSFNTLISHNTITSAPGSTGPRYGMLLNNLSRGDIVGNTCDAGITQAIYLNYGDRVRVTRNTVPDITTVSCTNMTPSDNNDLSGRSLNRARDRKWVDHRTRRERD